MQRHLIAGLAVLAAVSAAILGPVLGQTAPSLPPDPKPIGLPPTPLSVGLPQTSTPGIPDYAAAQEGKPIDTRPPELSTDKPLFPEQTRAPYHRTAPYKLTQITGALHAPWAIAFLPDGKFLVTEKLPGTLRVIDKAGNIAEPVKGLEALGVTWPETGLLDVALDPHFAANHRIFFVFFAFDKGMIGGIQIARAIFNEATNSLSDVQVIFRTTPETPSDNNPGVGSRIGGRLAIGPDGFLYMSVGDRDFGGQYPWRMAQTLDTDLGKIIRVALDGRPAPGNPFIGRPRALPEIWATGQRNQEGLAFDSDGKLWESEHGPRGGDELNLIEKGRNYGWPIISHGIDYGGKPTGEGDVAKAGMEQPVYYWSPSTAPSGIAFYKGDLFPEWKNSVFVCMLRGNSLERLTLSNGKVVNEEPLLTEVHMRIRDVRVGPDGAVYALTDSGVGNIGDNTSPTSKFLMLTPTK